MMNLLRGSDGGTVPGQGVCPRCWEESLGAGSVNRRCPRGRFPEVQIMTIAELLAGKELEYPKLALATFKKAPRRYRKPEQEGLW